ncbi:MAG: superoxide dismutase [Bacteroidales bacterium]|nr:superoxide dismutase [Bacteroidales bacterium]
MQLISLPYDPSALEPVISASTLSFHHGKHLQAYVNNLNAALPGTPYERLPLEDIVRKADGAIFNNAGQILNHNLYFTQFRSPRQDNAPTGPLSKAIKAQFGSFEDFKAEFAAKGAGLFGSGWVWLSSDAEGNLHITQEPNAGNPVTKGFTPLLTFDVWEHAYYLDYQNRRPDHLNSLWSIIDWDVVGKRYNG